MSESEFEDFLQAMYTRERATQKPCVSDATAAYLRYLLRLERPMKVLEVGTCEGYSTLQMARELRAWKGHLTSMEYSQPAHTQAQRNITQLGLENTVSLQLGDALELIPLLPDLSLDFAFIDGEKKSTLAFVRSVWPKLRPGAKVIVDDVLKYRKKMEDFWQWVEGQTQLPYQVVGTETDDGLMVLQRY